MNKTIIKMPISECVRQLNEHGGCRENIFNTLRFICNPKNQCVYTYGNEEKANCFAFMFTDSTDASNTANIIRAVMPDEIEGYRLPNVVDFLREYDDTVNTVETSNTRLKAHRHICKELSDTYAKKNADYGDSVVKTFDDFGLTAFAVRIADKFNRFTNLVKGRKAEVKDESIRDTLVDMANYCLLAVVEMDVRNAEALNNNSQTSDC